MGDHEEVSLKEFLIDKIENLQLSIKLAHASMEKRLESMNEFRNSLKDQENKYVTYNTFDILHKQVEDLKDLIQRLVSKDTIELMQKQIDELRLSKANLEGKASQNSVNIATIMAAIGVLLALIDFILKFYSNIAK